MVNLDQDTCEAGQNAYEARDFVRALKIWHPLAEHGDARAQVGTALCLMYGSVGKGQLIQTDYKKAIEWLLKAVDQGYDNGQVHLAQCYEQGRGVARDNSRAAELYSRAADQGHAWAQFKLAWFYASGETLPKDDGLALKWYRKAAERGEATSQRIMAIRHLTADGVRKDVVLAYVYYLIGGKKATDPREPPPELDAFWRLTLEQKAEANEIAQGWKPGFALPQESSSHR